MYNDEIAFLERRLAGKKIAWKAVAPLEQLASNGLSQFDALEVVNRLKLQLEAKCQKHKKIFSSMVSIIKDSIVVVKVPLLREVFGDEIDGFSGGGGRKMRVNPNPLPTGMRR
jgi:hypothetical protein